MFYSILKRTINRQRIGKATLFYQFLFLAGFKITKHIISSDKKRILFNTLNWYIMKVE